MLAKFAIRLGLIVLITTSEIRITCIIDETKLAEAVRILHEAFELETIS